MTRLALPGAVALAALAAGAAIVLALLLRNRAADLAPGPLACPDACPRLALAFPVDVHRPFTYGLLLLRNRGRAPAVLERVRPGELTPGMRLVGAVVVPVARNPWHVTADDHARFPPANLVGRVRALAGYAVAPTRGPGDALEVLLGFVLTRAGRFGFRDLAVEYRVGERRYRAVFPYRLRVCAPARIHRLDCRPPPLDEEGLAEQSAPPGCDPRLEPRTQGAFIWEDIWTRPRTTDRGEERGPGVCGCFVKPSY